MAKPGNAPQDVPSAGSQRTLSRGRVVEAALAVIDRGGVDALSMRSLAADLGVTPMALYNYVGGKQDLMRAVAGRLLSQLDFDNGAQGWRERVAGCFRTLRTACLRHPGAARLLEVDGVAPVAIFAPMRVTVAALTGAGLSAAEALRAYFTLIAFTLGQARYQAQGPLQAFEPGPVAEAGRLDDRLAETIRPALQGEWDFDAAFEFGLALILDGVEAALRKVAAT